MGTDRAQGLWPQAPGCPEADVGHSWLGLDPQAAGRRSQSVSELALTC